VSKRVLLFAPDLLFRAKLRAVVAAAGGSVARDGEGEGEGEGEPIDLAVVMVEAPGALERIRGLVASGTPVLAFGSHVLADQLRDARTAGAVAVPNSEVERRLTALLVTPSPAPGSGADGPSPPSAA